MPPSSLEGQTLGKYRLLEPLGRGGMAQVYRAYHPQLDRYVAVKVLRSDLVEEAEFLARFQREARSVAALRHPNIVQVYDADVEGEIYYMVMELLEGDTLKARLNAYRSRGERMPLGETLHILSNALEGLAYAHEEGIIHRDLKPANILLSRRSQAVLTDFGIAQIIGGTSYTISGALMGTLNYMAPEQGLENRCDTRSDLYSLGIVFYEMLTGKPPFDADTPLAILMKHLHDPLPLPRQLNPDIPPEFERVALKALAKRPEDRYQTAREMTQALKAAAEESKMIPASGFLPLPTVAANAAGLPSSAENDSTGGVFSGSARQQLTDLRFAEDHTDPLLGEHLQNANQPKAPAAVVAAIMGGVAAVIGAAAKASKSHLQSALERAKNYVWPSIHVTYAAVFGAGLLVLGNVCALVSMPLARHGEIFGRGWPMELLLVGILLSLLMAALQNIWLLIPAGILVGNGILFAFYAITGWWGLWTFFWPLEPLLLGCVIAFTIWLAKRAGPAPWAARPLGYGLALLAVIFGAAASIGVAFVTFIGYFQ
jgi:serine/threonine protein kinase